MLCLTFNKGEWVQIGRTFVKVLEVRNGQVRLGIEAQKSTKIVREKLAKKMAWEEDK